MKTILFVLVALIFVTTPVYGELLSDATGLVNRLDVEIGGQTFEVETVSNFNVHDFEFVEDDKRLTLFISSGLENNLGDLIIPQNLLGGNMTFYLNGLEYFPKVAVSERVTFVTLNFTGSGENKLDVFGTSLFFGLTEEIEYTQNEPVHVPQLTESDNDSMLWVILAVLLIGIAVFFAMRIKKKN